MRWPWRRKRVLCWFCSDVYNLREEMDILQDVVAKLILGEKVTLYVLSENPELHQEGDMFLQAAPKRFEVATKIDQVVSCLRMRERMTSMSVVSSSMLKGSPE